MRARTAMFGAPGPTVAMVAVLAIAMLATGAPVAFGAASTECVPTADRSHSVARLWDEALLDAIRRDLPAPTVHARNLFHTSAAMWDAWAAYDPVADGYLVEEEQTAPDIEAARERAISYAAYRILSHRYRDRTGGKESLAQFKALMGALCYPVGRSTVKGDTPTALGNRIAAAFIEYGLSDGARERAGYTDKRYAPVNEPMIVGRPGTVMADPNRWQPLALEESISQNGIPIPVGPQLFVGPHWGHVKSFGLPVSEPGLPIDPGAPPLLHDPATDAQFKAEAVDVIRLSSMLDPSNPTTIDISPAAYGGSTLGTNDGTGWDVNPATGQPYEPNWVSRADFARVLAEFWADGPASETPPGHWNTIANSVADSALLTRRMAGQGDIVDPLEWDVKTYFALNGALHDAAIAAWGAKGYYDSVRPISMIRYMGGLGQSSDPDGPSYHPDGLPLVPGLVDVVTPESSAPGQRHEHLRDYIGEVTIRAWTGNPDDPETGVGGVDWIRAVEWVPYQRATFVTPAFAGFVSGHSTFSRAAAVVLTAITADPFFPGGLSEWTIPAGGLGFEAGPSTDITLQWATYGDAADQAGLSRLYGGIHIPADDFGGRLTGAQCGQGAWALATRYFDGSARA